MWQMAAAFSSFSRVYHVSFCAGRSSAQPKLKHGIAPPDLQRQPLYCICPLLPDGGLKRLAASCSILQHLAASCSISKLKARSILGVLSVATHCLAWPLCAKMRLRPRPATCYLLLPPPPPELSAACTQEVGCSLTSALVFRALPSSLLQAAAFLS